MEENNTRKPRNNSCVSMVNEFLGVGGFSKVYRFKKEKDKAVKMMKKVEKKIILRNIIILI